MAEKLVVVGNGMAPGRMLEHLLEAAPERYEVTIFNAEPRVNYDRIMLSPVLSGEKGYEQIIIHGDGWYIKNGITLYKGHKIVAIDRTAKTVSSDRGVTTPYDKLVIATGSTPFILPVPGNNLAGRPHLPRSRRRGGDAACCAIAGKGRGHRRRTARPRSRGRPRTRGMDVTVVHLMPTLMERQLDPAAGHLLQRAIEARGIKVITKASTKAHPRRAARSRPSSSHDGTRAARRPRRDGGRHPAERMRSAKDAGLEVNRGIVVDDDMRTSDPDIFALGECVELGGQSTASSRRSTRWPSVLPRPARRR